MKESNLIIIQLVTLDEDGNDKIIEILKKISLKCEDKSFMIMGVTKDYKEMISYFINNGKLEIVQQYTNPQIGIKIW